MQRARGLERLAMVVRVRHHVSFVRVVDPHEQQPPLVGTLRHLDTVPRCRRQAFGRRLGQWHVVTRASGTGCPGEAAIRALDVDHAVEGFTAAVAAA